MLETPNRLEATLQNEYLSWILKTIYGYCLIVCVYLSSGSVEVSDLIPHLFPMWCYLCCSKNAEQKSFVGDTHRENWQTQASINKTASRQKQTTNGWTGSGRRLERVENSNLGLLLVKLLQGGSAIKFLFLNSTLIHLGCLEIVIWCVCTHPTWEWT